MLPPFMSKSAKKKKAAARKKSVRREHERASIRTPSPPVPWAFILPRAALIVAAILAIYWPVIHGSWLWDDDLLITNNQLIHDPDGLWRIWFQPWVLIDFFPITVTVQWIEWQLWGMDTTGYHLLNIFLHALSALLVWRLFSKLGLRLAWVGGLLFAIHPVMVESVAWIAEVKNTVSLPPFLLAMTAWVDYERTRKKDDYFLALGFFVIAMLSKSTMVMFPFIILLFAWWKRDRIAWSDLKASAPFFAVSLAVGLMLIYHLKHGVGEETIPLGGPLSRLALAGLSLSFYFATCFLPVNLLPLYPQWQVHPPSAVQFLPWPFILGALYWFWMRRQGWGRHVLLGLGFFIIMILPFIGFRVISFMRFTWVMDHFLYLPILGLIGLVIAGLGEFARRLPGDNRSRLVRTIGLGGAFALLALSSHRYASIYVNSIELWTYTLRINPDAWPGYNNLGNALDDVGKVEEAKAAFEQAIRLHPNYPEAHNDLAIAWVHLGHLPEAVEEFKIALQYCPNLQAAQENLAKVEALQREQAQKKP